MVAELLLQIRVFVDCKNNPASKESLKCYDCALWCGRCMKGHFNRTALDPACEDFQQRQKPIEKVRAASIFDFLRPTT